MQPVEGIMASSPARSPFSCTRNVQGAARARIKSRYGVHALDTVVQPPRMREETSTPPGDLFTQIMRFAKLWGGV
jgi:hypothetical protein